MRTPFRALRQWLSNKEVGVLGVELERLQEDLIQSQIKCDSLGERLDRLQSKYGMRAVREARSQQGQLQQRPIERSMSDDEILGEIEALARSQRH